MPRARHDPIETIILGLKLVKIPIQEQDLDRDWVCVAAVLLLCYCFVTAL